jgi:hypothetical protein
MVSRDQAKHKRKLVPDTRETNLRVDLILVPSLFNPSPSLLFLASTLLSCRRQYRELSGLLLQPISFHSLKSTYCLQFPDPTKHSGVAANFKICIRGGAGFEFRPEHWIFRLKPFVVFLSPSTQMPA